MRTYMDMPFSEFRAYCQALADLPGPMTVEPALIQRLLYEMDQGYQEAEYWRLQAEDAEARLSEEALREASDNA